MRRPRKSTKSVEKNKASLKSDIHGSLLGRLREVRLERGLSQQQLANVLGLRQRQISDLERAAMDPRLSTVQNVARALDLELILIPRQLISAVDGLQRAAVDGARRPLYVLDADDADAEDVSRVEVGGTGAPTDPNVRSPQRSKVPG